MCWCAEVGKHATHGCLYYIQKHILLIYYDLINKKLEEYLIWWRACLSWKMQPDTYLCLFIYLFI